MVCMLHFSLARRGLLVCQRDSRLRELCSGRSRRLRVRPRKLLVCAGGLHRRRTRNRRSDWARLRTARPEQSSRAGVWGAVRAPLPRSRCWWYRGPGTRGDGAVRIRRRDLCRCDLCAGVGTSRVHRIRPLLHLAELAEPLRRRRNHRWRRWLDNACHRFVPIVNLSRNFSLSICYLFLGAYFI